jgi:hypothetical protein
LLGEPDDKNHMHVAQLTNHPPVGKGWSTTRSLGFPFDGYVLHDHFRIDPQHLEYLGENYLDEMQSYVVPKETVDSLLKLTESPQ